MIKLLFILFRNRKKVRKLVKVFLALAGASLVLGLVACGGSTQLKVANTPQARKAEALVKSCLGKTNWLTKSGRDKFVTCIAPKGKKVQVEKCARNAIAHGSYFTKGQRARVEEAVINCVVSA